MIALLVQASVAVATGHSQYLGKYDCHLGQAFDRMASPDQQKEAKSHPLNKDESKKGRFSLDIQDSLALVTPSQSDPFMIGGERAATWGAIRFDKGGKNYEVDTFEFKGNPLRSDGLGDGENAVAVRVEFWPQYTYMWVDMPSGSEISSGPARYHSIFAGCVKAGSKK